MDWALNYAIENSDTLVVVTADHETGGLLIEPANINLFILFFFRIFII